MKITRLQLSTSQLQDLKTFYVMVLGFELQDENDGAFTIKTGTTLLQFKSIDPSENSQPTYHFAFNIPENQIEDARKWLYSRSIPLLRYEDNDILDFPHWNAKALYFLDPANNIVEFIARHDIANSSATIFNAQSIVSVSEIGLPVPEVAPMHAEVQQHLGLPIYSSIGNTFNFCPMGDVNGLFIIVRENRTWLPTELKNGIYPTTITIAGTEAKEVTFENLPYTIKIA